MNKLFFCVFTFAFFSCNSNRPSGNDKIVTKTLFLQEDSAIVDTLSIGIKERYSFYNRTALKSILTKETLNYQYGDCGMGIIDKKDPLNKILQFLSEEYTDLPDFRIDDVTTLFALTEEFNQHSGATSTIATVITTFEKDTISEPSKVIMTFAFIDTGSKDTLGYQWTNLFSWKKLGTLTYQYRSKEDFDELNNIIDKIDAVHNH